MRSVRLTAFTLASGLVLATLPANAGMAATTGKRVLDRGDVRMTPRARHSSVVRRPPARSRAVAPVAGTVGVVDPSMSAPPGPLIIIQEGPPPVLVAEEPPTPPVQPSYSWYYCGPKGTLPQPGERAQVYCLSGIHPSVSMLPGPGKTLDQFQTDDLACQRWASTQAGTLPGEVSSASVASSPMGGSLQERYDSAYQRCMHTKEHRLPGVARAAPPAIGTFPPPAPR